MPRSSTSFASPNAKAEEAIIEAQARVDRARETFLCGLHRLSADLHNEMISTKNDLRRTAIELSGVEDRRAV